MNWQKRKNLLRRTAAYSLLCILLCVLGAKQIHLWQVAQAHQNDFHCDSKNEKHLHSTTDYHTDCELCDFVPQAAALPVLFININKATRPFLYISVLYSAPHLRDDNTDCATRGPPTAKIEPYFS